MLRDKLRAALKIAMIAKNKLEMTTLRMVLAGIKDKDIADRAKGNLEGINDTVILSLFQTMIKQRRDSFKSFDTAGRKDLADKEAAEIVIIEKFLPEQMNDDAIKGAIDKIITTLETPSMKAMGQIMKILKSQYTGQMDFSKASQMIKTALS